MKTPIIQIYLFIALLLCINNNLQASDTSPVTLHIAEAGTLPTMISESDKYQITDLKLTGQLNGTDILYIREMVGRDYNGEPTSGSLVNLDIAGCDIVSGGEGYYRRSSIYSTSSNTIGNYMFYNCNLTSIAMPNSVTSIRSTAFEGCTSLKEFIVTDSNNNYSTLDGVLFNKNKTTLVCYPNAKGSFYSVPESVTIIESSAFLGCSGLISISIGNGVTSIGDYAFYDCTGLTSVTLPDKINTIGMSAFYRCTGLTNITIPDGVTNINLLAFSGCTSLKEFIVADSNKNYSSLDGVLFNKNKTTLICYPNAKGSYSYNVPESVAIIESSAFYDCTGLTSITLPNGVRSIRRGAFYNCSGLTSLCIPNSVTDIGSIAFSGCASLKEFIVTDSNKNYSSLDGVLFNKNKTTLICYPNAKGSSSYNVPESVTIIESAAFMGCSGLTSITLPNSLINLMEDTFKGCTGLTSIDLPDNIQTIDICTFYGCTSLTSVVLPQNVKIIDDEAFRGCTGLTSIVIPNGVTFIGGGAFSNCSLKNIILEDATTALSFDAIYSFEKTFNNCPIENLYLGRDITYSSSPFQGKTSLTLLTLGDLVTSIGDDAFRDCKGLMNITIPNEVISIGCGAFNGCTGLTGNLNIPNSVTSIGTSAFSGCTGLTSITIGNGVTSIGSSAFLGCTSLKEFSVDQDNQYYRTLDKVLYSKDKTSLICYPNAKGSIYSVPEGVRTIGYQAFYKCINLTSITLPNSLTSIGSSAFSGCMGLKSINLPNSLTSIGNNAFSDCTILTSIIIGNGVTSMGVSAFSGCTGLGSIYCYPTNPPTVGENGFQGVDKSTCKLYVPQNSYGAYWTTAPWYDFDNLIGFDPEVGVKITTLKGIKLYPNPVASALYIDLDTNKEIHNISIYNTSGQMIQKEVIVNSNIQLDVSSYPAGTYIVQASGTNNQLYNLGKFAKE